MNADSSTSTTVETDGFSGRKTAAIVGISYRQLDYWARTDLIRPSLADAAGSGSRRQYSYRDLLEAKRSLVHRLPQVLPADVTCNELLMNFCRGMIAADPSRRFPSAEDADLIKGGAASFHRQLIVGGLASEYENEIRAWLEDLD